MVRKLVARLRTSEWIHTPTSSQKGFLRPGLMVDVCIALLLYGASVMDDLPLLDRRGMRRIFSGTRVPNPTTFGRWLRRTGESMAPRLDELLWTLVRRP